MVGLLPFKVSYAPLYYLKMAAIVMITVLAIYVLLSII